MLFLRLVWGAMCLSRPRSVVAILGGPVDHRATTVTRLVGARHVVQSGVDWLVPTRRTLVVGGAVDLIHGASMALFGVLDPARRRWAWRECAIATAWGAGSLSAGEGRATRLPSVTVAA